jgi:hypothetical protein
MPAANYAARGCALTALGGYWSRIHSQASAGKKFSWRVWMDKKIDVGAIVGDIWWGILPIVGMLASVGLVALVMRLSIGKW